MIRTRHLVVTTAFLLAVVSVGGLGTLTAHNLSHMETQSATIVLGTPQDHYGAVVADAPTGDTAAFVERIRDSYVPPPVSVEEPHEAEPDAAPAPVVHTPVPQPAPTPEPLPVATIEEEVGTTSPATSTEDTASTSASSGTFD